MFVLSLSLLLRVKVNTSLEGNGRPPYAQVRNAAGLSAPCKELSTSSPSLVISIKCEEFTELVQLVMRLSCIVRLASYFKQMN